MSLESFWPTSESIENCIDTRAEVVSEEILLAVHQDIPLSRARIGPTGEVDISSKERVKEEAILEHLLSPSSEGSLLVPITGASGVGKSHLIRILAARLKAHPKSDNYLVIRIPKEASLRSIVETILNAEPLKTPAYDQLRNEFKNANEEVSLDAAAALLETKLQLCLQKYHDQKMVLANESRDHGLRARAKLANSLADYIRDPVVYKYFRSQVLSRLIKRSFGVRSGREEEIEVLPQFTAEDFNLPDGLNSITEASPSVERFYMNHIHDPDGQSRKTIVELLNQDILDQAIGELYRLNQTLSGKTLGEIINDIRVLLFEQDQEKELVLLVEDFAALVGIQEPLAKILIQDASEYGQKKKATIRSAIAVTDGYLVGRNTIATRAGYEWIVESKIESEEEILDLAVGLFAKYLNASRHGRKRIEEFVLESGGSETAISSSWEVPVYKAESEEEKNILDGFGYFKEIPLFPFTRQAIAGLMHLNKGSTGSLIFNPRFIIRVLVRDALIKGRDAFLNKRFPSVDYPSNKLDSNILEWLVNQNLATEEHTRFERFLTIWGNFPTSREELATIDQRILDAFHLPKLDLFGTIKKSHDPKPYVAVTPPSPKVPVPIGVSAQLQGLNSAQLEKYKKVREELELWISDNQRLSQNTASKIRKNVISYLSRTLFLNRLFVRACELEDHIFLSIPNSGGEGNINRQRVKSIDLVPDPSDPKGYSRRELSAVYRFLELSDGEFTYKEAEDDYLKLQTLVGRLQPKVEEVILQHRLEVLSFCLGRLKQCNLILGIDAGFSTPHQIQKAFETREINNIAPFGNESNSAFYALENLRQDALTLKGRLMEIIYDFCSAFQGTGKTSYAFDFNGLVEASKSNLPEEKEGLIKGLYFKESSSLFNNLNDLSLRSRWRNTIAACRDFQALMDEKFDWTGESPVQEVVEATISLIKEFANTGQWVERDVGCSTMAASKTCEEVKSKSYVDFMKTLREIDSIDSTKDMEIEHFLLFAKLDLSKVASVSRFIEISEKLQIAVEKYISLKERAQGTVTKADQIQKFKACLDLLSENTSLFSEH